MIKIDVEGFEAEVLQGATKTLSAKELKVVIIELNGSGNRYGFNEADIHKRLLDFGFLSYTYKPFTRLCTTADHWGTHNTIYVCDLEFVSAGVCQRKIKRSKKIPYQQSQYLKKSRLLMIVWQSP